MLNYSKLSQQAFDKIKFWKSYRKDKPKLDWDITFLDLAYKIRENSHDFETQCGAVLVRDKHIIATGYNGFIHDIPDDILPNVRPKLDYIYKDNGKYNWMIHAEHNAILDCARRGISAEGCTIYVTGEPCLNCYQFMYQAGISNVIYGNNTISMINNDIEYNTNVEIFLWLVRDKFISTHIDYPLLNKNGPTPLKVGV